MSTLSSKPDTASLGAPSGRSLLASLSRAGDGYRYLLILRFALLNLIGLALIGLATMHGLTAPIYADDPTRLVTLITAIFLVGLGLTARRVFQISSELNYLREGAAPAGSRVAEYLNAVGGRDGQSRSLLASSLRLKLASRIKAIQNLAGALVVLGLIGTVIGFIIALSGVDPSAAGDAAAIGPMVAALIDGMSVALHTTLVGSVLNVWLMMNYRIAEGGSVALYTALIETGERD
ncbi:MAG: MotA/TolQ/ExbB proton channel family protein [Geminicoccaceae bacterium]